MRARPFVVRIAYLAALSVVALLLAWNAFVRQINAGLGDILFRLRGPAPSHTAGRIVLLAIDDGTAAKYGTLPLRRSLLAEGLYRLAACLRKCWPWTCSFPSRLDLPRTSHWR